MGFGRCRCGSFTLAFPGGARARDAAAQFIPPSEYLLLPGIHLGAWINFPGEKP